MKLDRLHRIELVTKQRVPRAAFDHPLGRLVVGVFDDDVWLISMGQRFPIEPGSDSIQQAGSDVRGTESRTFLSVQADVCLIHLMLPGV